MSEASLVLLFVVYSLGLITGPLVLFSLLRVVLKVLRRQRKT